MSTHRTTLVHARGNLRVRAECSCGWQGPSRVMDYGRALDEGESYWDHETQAEHDATEHEVAVTRSET